MPSRKQITLFFLVNLVLASWFLDRAPNDNTMSRALAVDGLVEHGSLDITARHELTGDKAHIGSRYFSDKAPLPVLIVAPFWWMCRALGATQPDNTGASFATLLGLGGLLCGCFPFALIITLTWIELRRRARLPAIWTVLLATFPFYGSFLFVYSGSFYAHLLGALFMLLALIAGDRDRPLLAGSMAGAAVLCEYPLVVFPLFWTFGWLLSKKMTWRTLLRFAAGGLPALFILMIYNYAISGHPLSLGYQHEANYAFMDDGLGFGAPSWRSIVGLSFSGYRGLFIYMPALLFCTLAGIMAARSSYRMVLPGIGPSLLASFLVIAAYGMWWGGWAYGPRHLTALAVLAAYRGLPLVAAQRWMRGPAVTCAAIGFLFAFAAKATTLYALPTEEHSPLTSLIMPRFFAGDLGHNTWATALGTSEQVSTLLFVPLFLLGIFALVRIDRSIAPIA